MTKFKKSWTNTRRVKTMNRYTWTENGFTFKRINKAQARRAYNNG